VCVTAGGPKAHHPAPWAERCRPAVRPSAAALASPYGTRPLPRSRSLQERGKTCICRHVRFSSGRQDLNLRLARPPAGPIRFCGFAFGAVEPRQRASGFSDLRSLCTPDCTPCVRSLALTQGGISEQARCHVQATRATLRPAGYRSNARFLTACSAARYLDSASAVRAWSARTASLSRLAARRDCHAVDP
jgi:hypothetical protein